MFSDSLRPMLIDFSSTNPSLPQLAFFSVTEKQKESERQRERECVYMTTTFLRKLIEKKMGVENLPLQLMALQCGC